jgi:hypothetical protein
VIFGPNPAGEAHAREVAPSHAWEAANAWTVEPDDARRRYDAVPAMVT